MPDTSQHLDIMIRASNIRHELHARLLSAVHRCISQSDEISVSWPDWKDQPADFGLLFRAFGSNSALDGLARLVLPLADGELIRIYPRMETPATTALVTYWRDRVTEKKTEKYVLRENKHRAARDLVPTSRTSIDIQEKGHYLKMYSDRTKQRYSIFVARETGPSSHSGGRSYGLGYSVPHF